MKTRLLLLSVFLGMLVLPIVAQDKTTTDKTEPCDCASASDSVLLQLNNGEGVIVVKSGKQLSVSLTNMGKFRKSLDCPDIFAPPAPKPAAPSIETPVAPPDIKLEMKEPIRGKPFFLPDPVFFRINKSVIDDMEWGKVELAVNYLNDHPGSMVVVTGYADKKTGSATTNLRLSKLRSEAVEKALQTKYGINKNRISVNWKGDGLQPFQLENDKNRAVLFLINP